jgi:hypothetical protein
LELVRGGVRSSAHKTGRTEPRGTAGLVQRDQRIVNNTEGKQPVVFFRKSPNVLDPCHEFHEFLSAFYAVVSILFFLPVLG